MADRLMTLRTFVVAAPATSFQVYKMTKSECRMTNGRCAHYVCFILVGRLYQPRMLSGFTQRSRGDASDIDGQLVRASERARTSQTPDNSSERSRRICLADSAIYCVAVGLPVSANCLSRLSCSLSMLSTAGAIFSKPPTMNPPTLYES